MSDDKDDKHDVEDKLMADNEANKNYGTDGQDIEEAPQPEREHVTIKTSKAKVSNKPSLLRTLSSYEPPESNISFIHRVATFVFDTILGLIALAITNILQIACIIIGSVYINDCPLSPGIPVILIVTGSVNVLVCVIETIKRRINRQSQVIRRLELILTCLKITSTVSFLIWIVVLYDVPTPDYYDTSAQNYCSKTVYLFSFWLLTSLLILLAVIMVFSCCCCCLAGYIATTDKVDGNKEQPKDSDQPTHQESI